MSKFICEIIKSDESTKDKLQFTISGSGTIGLDKTVINGIRRTLLSSIETYAFRTTYDNTNIIIEKNNTSLHNEFLLDRIGLIPLYLNPEKVKYLEYLFVLSAKHDNSNPITIITANNFNIYRLKDTILESPDFQNGMINEINKSNYDMDKPLNDFKKEVFKPYMNKYYSIITEMKSTNSEENVQELVLYGSPSLSIAKEDSRWQAVSGASYSYKIDEDLLTKVCNDKIKLNQESITDKEQYKKEFIIKAGQRYFHRDVNGEPYYYNFMIEGQHYFNNKKLFIRANEIIIKSLEIFRDELDNLKEDEKSLIKLIFNKDTKDNVINMIVEMQYVIANEIYHGFDDTLGSIIQAHISGKMINDSSDLNLCGYKRTHPLENKIMFTVSLNSKSDIEDKIKKEKVVDTFKQCCYELIDIYNVIISAADGI